MMYIGLINDRSMIVHHENVENISKSGIIF